MPHDDKMTLTVLEDGRGRLVVDGISGANHALAEALVKEFARLMGGPLEIARQGHGHTHINGEAHSHHHEEH